MQTARTASRQPQQPKSSHTSKKTASKRADGKEKQAESKKTDSKPKADKKHQVAFGQKSEGLFPEIPKEGQSGGDTMSLGEINDLKAKMDTGQSIMETLQNSSRKTLEENPDDSKAKLNANLSGNLSSLFQNGSKVLQQHGQDILKELEKQIQNGNEPDLNLLQKDGPGFGGDSTSPLFPFGPSEPFGPSDDLFGPSDPLFPSPPRFGLPPGGNDEDGKDEGNSKGGLPPFLFVPKPKGPPPKAV